MAATGEPIIVGLDIGSSKIAALAVTFDPDGGLRYLEAAHPDPLGSIRAGTVTSISAATDAIQHAIEELEEKVGRRITSACIAVGGTHLASQNVRGVTAITPRNREREIVQEDVVRALQAAKAQMQYGDNVTVLHEIPRAYIVDGQIGVQDPHGMAGYQLEVEVHCVTGASTILQNVIKCVRLAHLQPLMVVAAPLASGEAVRDPFADASALAVLDIGLETTKLTVYVNGAIWQSQVLPIGGLFFTQGIGSALRLSPTPAEELKQWYGQCNLTDVRDGDLVPLPPSTGEDALVPRSEIVAALRERAELFANEVSKHLHAMRRSNVDPETLILTGGGADLPGLDTILTQALDVPVYPGVPSGIRGLPPLLERPAFATVVGLVKYYVRYGLEQEAWATQGKRHGVPRVVNSLRGIMRVVMP